MKFSVFTDGGARGNPGPAAVGVVIKNEKGEIIHQFGKVIGKTTNNVAEYTAVVEALEWIVCHPERSEGSLANASRLGQAERSLDFARDDKSTLQNDIAFFLDSSLVVNQLNGLFKIKDRNLQNLAALVHQLETEIKIFPVYIHIPREKNWQADKLVNQALDSFHVPSADTKAQKE